MKQLLRLKLIIMISLALLLLSQGTSFSGETDLNLTGVINTPGFDGQKEVNLILDKADKTEVNQFKAKNTELGVTHLAEPVKLSIKEPVEALETQGSNFSKYVTFKIPVNQSVDINNTVGVMLDENGDLIPVPTLLTEDNGQVLAIIKSKQCGIFSVISNKKSFLDTSGHWAEYDIGVMASKLLVSGSNDEFKPDEKITRAQFATMIVRALAIGQQKPSEEFSDIENQQWYAETVYKAFHAGIVKGFKDGTFRPNEYITREQMTVLLINSMQKVDSSDNTTVARGNLLDQFKDNTNISPWAKQAVIDAVDNGFLQGCQGYLKPDKPATRAEAVVMVRKLLRKIGFITPTFKVTTPIDNLITNKSPIMVKGQVELGCQVAVNGKKAEVNEIGNFSIREELRKGKNTIRVNVIDTQGHKAGISRTVTYDSTAPDFDVTNPANKLITNENSIKVEGYADSDSVVEINGVEVVINEEGYFSGEVDLNLGNNLITATASDSAGNKSAITREIIFDNITPDLFINNPEIDKDTGYDMVIVTGYSEADARVEINGDRVDTDSEGNFTKLVDLDEDENTITVTAEDKAGNISTLIRTINFDENRVTSFNVPENIITGSRTGISYNLSTNAYVTLKIYKENGHRVKTLLSSELQTLGSHSIRWDGTDDKDREVSNGKYSFVLAAKNENGRKIGEAEITVMAAKSPILIKESEDVDKFNPLEDEFEVEFSLSCDALISAKVFQGSKLVKTIIDEKVIDDGFHHILWDGKDENGQFVGDGQYLLKVEAVSPTVSSFNSKLISITNVERLAHVSYKVPIISLVQTEQNSTIQNSTIQDAEDTPTQYVQDTVMHDSQDSPPAQNVEDTTMEDSQDSTIQDTADAPKINGFSISPSTFRIGDSQLYIKYELNQDASVTINIVNSDGDVVHSILDNEEKKAGKNYVLWDGKIDEEAGISEGVYEVQISTNNSEIQKKSFTAAYQSFAEYLNIIPFIFNDDGSLETEAEISYQLSGPAQITIELRDNHNSVIRILFDDIQGDESQVKTYSFKWDGKDDNEKLVGDGKYYVWVTVVSPELGMFKSYARGEINIERRFPSISDVDIRQNPFLVYKIPIMPISYMLSENTEVSAHVYQGNTLIRTLVNKQQGRVGKNFVTWDGKDDSGKIVDLGDYKLVITAVDAFDNSGQISRNIKVYPYPTVVSTAPYSDEGDVSVEDNIVIAFCDRVLEGQRFEDISLKVEGREIQFTTDIRGKTVVITPSEKLAYGTTYTVKIPTGTVKDLMGNVMQNSYDFNFTTETIPRTTQPPAKLELTEATTSLYGTKEGLSATLLKVDEDKAFKIISNYDRVNTVVVSSIVDSDTVEAQITGTMVKELAEEDSLIEVKTTKGSIRFPAREVEIKDIARQMDVDIKDLTLKVILGALEADSNEIFKKVSNKQKLTLLTEPIKFAIEVTDGENTITISEFDKYISYNLYLPEEIKTSSPVAITINQDNIMPIPSKLSNSNTVIIKSKEHQIFAVIDHKQNFTDINNHWAKKEINLLASQMIVSGIQENIFEPNRKVTRAEFATMIAKGLALKPVTYTGEFCDVKYGDWFAGYVAAAADVGLVQGYYDRTFKPNAYIKREEAAAIVRNAMVVVGLDTVVHDTDINKFLERFEDRNKIHYWAEEAVAGAVKNGLINGYKDGTLAPGKSISRAESAVIIRKLLSKSGLI